MPKIGDLLPMLQQYMQQQDLQMRVNNAPRAPNEWTGGIHNDPQRQELVRQAWMNDREWNAYVAQSAAANHFPAPLPFSRPSNTRPTEEDMLDWFGAKR